MKFLVPNYSCLQNPWLGGLLPPDPRSLCPLSSTEFVEPSPKKIPGYATGRHCLFQYVHSCIFITTWLSRACHLLLIVNHPPCWRVTQLMLYFVVSVPDGQKTTAWCEVLLCCCRSSDVTSCHLVSNYWSFGGAVCSHRQALNTDYFPT